MLRQASHAQCRIWSFHCSACGKCCNSAPALSLPELFYHQDRFIGCLGIRRMKRPCPGDSLGNGYAAIAANAEDCAAFDDSANRYLHSIRRYSGSDHDVLLATHGFDIPGLGNCPALGSDGRCTIHSDRKPAGCCTVPLDALVPDEFQHLVLAERQIDAHFSGANCIKRGINAGTLPLIQGRVGHFATQCKRGK